MFAARLFAARSNSATVKLTKRPPMNRALLMVCDSYIPLGVLVGAGRRSSPKRAHPRLYRVICSAWETYFRTWRCSRARTLSSLSSPRIWLAIPPRCNHCVPLLRSHQVANDSPESAHCFSAVLDAEQIVPACFCEDGREPTRIRTIIGHNTVSKILNVSSMHSQFEHTYMTIQRRYHEDLASN